MNRVTSACAAQRMFARMPAESHLGIGVQVESSPMNSNAFSRPIVAEFSGKALRHNAAVARAKLPSDGQYFAVIKAEAYGHGLIEVASRLASDVDGFAVLELAAARALRDQGYEHPILMLEGFFNTHELQVFSELNLSTVVHRADQIESLAKTRLGQPLDVFLKLNTGMNRLGLPLDEAAHAYAALEQLGQVRRVTVMTHFADADNERGTGWQLDRLTAAWPEATTFRTSFANSAALLAGPAKRETIGDIARPGIMLYGASPWGASEPQKTAAMIGLEPVMSLKSELIGIQHLLPGDRVGYGGTFRAEKPMTIGIVACGYADGYPRHASNQAPILVNGIRTRVIGRVSMDMLCCDLDEVPDAGVGSPVTLWGESLPADEVAEASGTIAYELFCGVTPRVPRIWRD